MPVQKISGRKLEDFYFIEQEDPDQVLSIILELVCERIPNRFGFKSFEDIQVLVPMHKGIIGTENLNKRLQDVLNPNQIEIMKGERIFRIGDRVIQNSNSMDISGS